MSKKDNKKGMGCGCLIIGFFIIGILSLIVNYFEGNPTSFIIFISLVIIITLLIAIIYFTSSKNKKAITIALCDIDNMDGIEFELFTADLLKNIGYYNVSVTSASNDYGIDVLAEKDGIKYAIQCKRYALKVNNSAIQEVVAGKTYYNCNQGIVITNNYFTDNARELARSNNVILWDRSELIKMLQESKKTKQRPLAFKTKDFDDTEAYSNNDIFEIDETPKLTKEIDESTKQNQINWDQEKTIDEIVKDAYTESALELLPEEISPEILSLKYQLPSIEIFNSDSSKYNNSVKIYDLLDTFDFMNSKLSACLGKSIDGIPTYCDLTKTPHVLILGDTGTGKSICMNSIIVSLLCKTKPSEIRFLMIDSKKVEFSKYENIPHLLAPVVTDSYKASGVLGWAVSEMLNRYQKFSDTGVRDISGYNEYIKKHADMESMPNICIFIDGLELLILDCKKEVEDSISRIVQMGRATGMHIIISSQQERLTKKYNIRTTITTKIDNESSNNPYKLIYKTSNTKPITINGCIALDNEIEKMCNLIKNQGIKDTLKISDSFETIEELDPLFEDAVEVVLEAGKASTSFLQRKLGIGYSHGSKILEQMENEGIIGPQDGAKPRKILINQRQWIEMKVQDAMLN